MKNPNKNIENATPRPWGIEVTATTLWLGPLRQDGSGKVSEIVCSFDVDGLHRKAKEKQYANAALIVHCVNLYEALCAVPEAVKDFLPYCEKVEQSEKEFIDALGMEPYGKRKE